MAWGGIDDEPWIWGLRRVKPAYKNMPLPSEVLNRFDPAADEGTIPAAVKSALSQLDAWADRLPSEDLRVHLAENHHPLIETALGLDQDGIRVRLRFALGRGYGAAWRYADHYYNWRRAYEAAPDLLKEIEDFQGEYQEEIEQLAELRDRYSFGVKGLSEVRAAFAELRVFIDQTRAWAADAADMQKRFASNAPKIFLYLRIAEIFVCFSGKVPPLHRSGKFARNSDTIEGEFADFAEATLTVFGYPTPANGFDGVLRDIAKYSLPDSSGFGGLASRRRERRLDYGDLPSVWLLNGLNVFSDDEL